jgi:hypothetical protein
MSLRRSGRPIVIFFADAEIVKTFALIKDVFDGTGDAPDSLRADDEINAWTFGEKRLAFELRDAAHYADDGFCAVRVANLSDSRIKFVFSLFSDRAGIEQNHVSRRFVRGHFKAVGGKLRGDALGIGDVHLTAESFQINFFHIKLLRSETAKKTAKK